MVKIVATLTCVWWLENLNFFFFPKKKSFLLSTVKEILVSEKLLNKSFIWKDVSLGNCVFETLLGPVPVFVLDHEISLMR